MGESKIVRRGGGGGETLIPEQFIDVSGSAGSSIPHFWNEEKGIAYYGFVRTSDLYTSDELSSEVGITSGASFENGLAWIKYYWNGGIHFVRLAAIRHSVSWNTIASQGAVYGTGTTTSRKGNSATIVTQNREVIKNGITYIVRLMEGANVDPAFDPFASSVNRGLDLHNSEFSLILMNLHVATNSGSYQNSPTDGLFYGNWTDTDNYTNNDFVENWITNFNDNSFFNSGNGKNKIVQEQITGQIPNRLYRYGSSRMSFATGVTNTYSDSSFGWLPVLTVKHPSFTTYGKSGGFNQSEPDWT
jgi:hypothetical protein